MENSTPSNPIERENHQKIVIKSFTSRNKKANPNENNRRPNSTKPHQ